MNRAVKILIFTLSVMATACTEKVPDHIMRYELERHQIKVAKILEIGSAKSFKAADSLTICRAEFNKQKEQLTAIQRNFIDSISSKIDEAQQRIINGNDDVLKKAIERGLKSMEYKRKLALQIIDSYENHPESTSLNSIICKIAHYEQISDSVIGLVQQCTFAGRQGRLPEETFNRSYLLSIDNQTIISEIIEP